MRREGEGAEEVEEFGQEGTWGRGTEVREGGDRVNPGGGGKEGGCAEEMEGGREREGWKREKERGMEKEEGKGREE